MKLFLIGFMGSGKTYWGRLWANKSGMSFYDLDEMIEQQEGKTIAGLFEQFGEPWFRQKETDVLQTFAEKENCIIACGGGTPCFNHNMQWMNKNGTTVYLKATPREIEHRLISETEKRPLVKEIHPAELLSFIESKLNEREVVYITAKNILPVASITTDTINQLLKKR